MPELYMAGQKDELFNYYIFMQAIAHGTITSLINFFVTILTSSDMSTMGSSSDCQSFGVLVAISSLLSITLEVSGPRTPRNHGGLCLALTCYFSLIKKDLWGW